MAVPLQIARAITSAPTTKPFHIGRESAVRLKTRGDNTVQAPRATFVQLKPTRTWGHRDRDQPQARIANPLMTLSHAMAPAVMAWLRRRREAGCEVLLGDPGRAYLPGEGLVEVARYTVPTPDGVEAREEMCGLVYHLT